MKDIKGYKILKNKELKLKELRLKKEILEKGIARLDFDDYERIRKKGKQLREIEAQIERISEELEKYVSLEHLDEEEKDNNENGEINNKENDADKEYSAEVENNKDNAQKDFEEFKAEQIVSLREVLKSEDELDKSIEGSIEDEDNNTKNVEDKNEIRDKKLEKRAASIKQKTDKKTKKIKEKADLKISKIQAIINKDKEKREKCEEKLEELKNTGVVKVFAVKIAKEENNEAAIKKFKDDLETVKQQAREIELELKYIQSRILMNQLKQSEIRKDAYQKIEIREALDSLNKSAIGKAWIYTKAAVIAVTRSAKETFTKIKNKINEISKKDNKLKLNSGNDEEDIKIYEPKIKKENQIKSKYNHKIDYKSAYDSVKHHKETDDKEVSQDYRD